MASFCSLLFNLRIQVESNLIEFNWMNQLFSAAWMIDWKKHNRVCFGIFILFIINQFFGGVEYLLNVLIKKNIK